MNMNQLQKIEQFRKDLAIAETYEEIKLISDASAAYAEFARRNKLSKEKQDELGEFRMEIEAKKGRWLDEMFPNGNVKGDRGNKYKKAVDSPKGSLQLLGINYKESSNARLIAKQEELVQEVIEEIKKDAKKVVAPFVVQQEVRKRLKEKQKQESINLKHNRELHEAHSDNIVEPKFKVEIGQTWRLGKHLLTCGSAYDYDIKADAIISDPPYGIDYNPDWKKWDGTESDFNKIHGDIEEFDPRPFLNYDIVMLFGANYFTKYLPIGGWICWDKRIKDELDDMIGNPFELAWFKSHVTNKKAIMIRVLHGGVVNADSLIGNNQKRYHPTQKPIILMEEIINKITKEGHIVCDPFSGSGSTLLACQNTNRVCYAYEISPLYCEVILTRFQELYNITPCLA